MERREFIAGVGALAIASLPVAKALASPQDEQDTSAESEASRACERDLTNLVKSFGPYTEDNESAIIKACAKAGYMVLPVTEEKGYIGLVILKRFRGNKDVTFENMKSGGVYDPFANAEGCIEVACNPMRAIATPKL